ncbi:hypothetical protein GH714_030185 [Hevea brasiliensis]|uniref:Uncharacterized protein n=1 Tax=Hevea brasiliensis TaxID=3981 RepID=A0A6A6L4F1_HEVBR|nr:hypothetical protein GH714_030185 [Hevea brasiliensis]
MAAPSFASLPLWELILIQENDGGRTTLHYASSEGWFKKINLKDKACNFSQLCFILISSFVFNLNRICICYIADKSAQKLVFSFLNIQLNYIHYETYVQVGYTPLHPAVSTGKSELCEFLIEKGAEVDAIDRTCQTSLMIAVIC